ncbi:MAG TPA: hypothetical protein VII43_09165 [Opitutaceae bacterium]
MNIANRPWGPLCLLLLFACVPLRAQELTFLGGTTTDNTVKNSSYNWQIDYREDFLENFAASIAYINEGHVPGHHRDGESLEAWGNLPLFNNRVAFSFGGGIYYYYDTEPAGPAGSLDVHGTGPIYSIAATGYLSDRLFYRVMVNRISPAGDIKTTTASLGIGYWFGENRRPEGKKPGKEDIADAEFVTEPQLTLFGGQSVVNTLLSPSAYAAAVEYRQGIVPHLDGTASFIYEGDPKVARRSGIAFQGWPVNTFLDKDTSVGIGIGPYIFIDKKHPENSGTTLNKGLSDVGFHDPAAVAPLVSLTIARKFSDRWDVRIIWDRVVSNYNRDSDIFLVGMGYCWR